MDLKVAGFLERLIDDISGQMLMWAQGKKNIN